MGLPKSRIILSAKVSRVQDLIAVYADDVFVTAVVEEKNGLVGTSRLSPEGLAEALEVVVGGAGPDATAALAARAPAAAGDGGARPAGYNCRRRSAGGVSDQAIPSRVRRSRNSVHRRVLRRVPAAQDGGGYRD